MPSDRHIVSQDEVFSLLRAARAPAPAVEGLRDLADAMTMMGAHHLGTKARPARAAFVYGKGRIRTRRTLNLKRYPIPKGPFWPDPKSGKRPLSWHLEATLLLQLYRRDVMAGARVSRDGPAVRFIQRGLERVGLGYHETPAIEQALGRAARKKQI